MAEKTLKYFVVIRTHPGNVLPLSDELLYREGVRPYLGSSDIHKLSGSEDADIDAQTLAEMIAEGRFSESEFLSYCDGFGVAPRHSDGELNHLAAGGFLDIQLGQEIMSLSLPTDDSAVGVYSALVSFARQHQFRLWCPMPHVQGDISLEEPGHLPPHWDQYIY